MSGRSTPGLLRRLYSSSPAASIAVAITVLACAALAAAAPRALDLLFTSELRYAIAGIGDTQRDLVSVAIGVPANEMDEGLDRIHDALGPTLAGLTGEGRYAVVTDTVIAPRDVPERDDPTFELAFAVDPRMSEAVQVAEGRAPAPAGPVVEGSTVEIWLSVPSAEAMGWTVDEARTIVSAASVPVRVLLTGTFAALDADDERWQLVPGILEPFLFDDGNSTPRVTATAYLDPAGIGSLEPLGGSPSTTVWYPVDPGGAQFGQAQSLVDELRAFTSVSHAVSSGVTLGQVAPLTFREGIVGPVESVLARATATTAVVALVAAGPFGVAIAVLALATRLVAVRRRPSLALASARGGSEPQLRVAMALEGALLGVPAAAAGIVAAVVLVPGPFRAAAVLPAIVLGLAPAVLFAAAWRPQDAQYGRADLDLRRPWRFRWIVEVVIVGLAVAGTGLLITRGLVGGPGRAVVDPLLVVTPLLLALAGCIAVLRLYPLPLGAITRSLSRRDGVVGQLGSAIAMRGSAVPVAPVLAMVVGVAIAVFSTVLLTTIDRGAQTAVGSVVGGDLRVDGVGGDEAFVASVARIEGVDAVAGVDDAGPVVLRVDGVGQTVTLVIVDADTLGALRGTDLELGAGEDAVPVIVSSDLEISDAELVVEGEPVIAIATADPATGLVATSRWVMADASASEQLVGVPFGPGTVLIEVDDGADSAAVETAVAELGGDRLRITTPGSALAELRASPAIAGLRIALVIGFVVAALLAALALVLASIAGTRARSRVLSLLSTLGLSARQASGLAAWELAPTAAVSVVVGALLGLALPFIVLSAVDLRPFTSGSGQPAVEIPWIVVGAIVAGFAIVVVVAIGLVTAASRRASAANTLRMGDEPT